MQRQADPDLPSGLLGALLFALCFPAEAQQPKKDLADRISIGVRSATESARSEAIRLALRDLAT